jgi:arylsulfatase A-like enzyme
MSTLVKIFLKELLFWTLLPATFLIVYVTVYFQPVTSVLTHLFIIFLCALICFIVRIFLSRLCSPKLTRNLISLFYGSWLFVSIFFYATIIIGLRSWGRVPTEELVLSYIRQAPELCDALGASFWLVMTLIVIAFALTILIYRYLFYFEIPSLEKIWTVSSSPLKNIIEVFLLLFLILLSIKLYETICFTSADDGEPIKLTLYGGKLNPQSTSKKRSEFRRTLDLSEALVRKNYSISQNTHRKNVILIVVDGLRQDHLSVYDYKRDTSPYFKRLQKQGQLLAVQNVHGICGESVCGLGGIASARYVHQMPSNPFTLQQVLKLHGYRSQMILGGDHTNFYSLKHLYSDVDEYFDGSMAKGYYMNDDQFVLDKVDDLPISTGQPTFFQFHLMSAHTLGKRHKTYESFTPFEPYVGRTSGITQEKYTNYYDNGVRQVDSVIERIWQKLRDKQYLENALVVVTSDHGESLGEHGIFSHSNSVREELLKIPLLMSGFGDALHGQKLSQFPVSQIDIAPSILFALGISIPTSWQGIPIQAHIETQRVRPFAFFQMGAEFGFFDYRDASVTWKYWQNIKTGHEYVFNLSADPFERDNLQWRVPVELKDQWRKNLKNALPR